MFRSVFNGNAILLYKSSLGRSTSPFRPRKTCISVHDCKKEATKFSDTFCSGILKTVAVRSFAVLERHPDYAKEHEEVSLKD